MRVTADTTDSATRGLVIAAPPFRFNAKAASGAAGVMLLASLGLVARAARLTYGGGQARGVLALAAVLLGVSVPLALILLSRRNSRVVLADGQISCTNLFGRTKSLRVSDVHRVLYRVADYGSGYTLPIAPVLDSQDRCLVKFSAQGWAGEQLDRLWVLAGLNPNRDSGKPTSAGRLRSQFPGCFGFPVAHRNLTALIVTVVGIALAIPLVSFTSH
jgi:hypothetical protein